MSKPQPQPDPAILDPTVSASCLDFLLIELVPLAQRITEQLHAREQALREEYKRSQFFNKPSKPGDRSSAVARQSQDGAKVGTVSDSSVKGSATGTAGGSTNAEISDAMREAVFWRLDGMGYRVGQGLVERFSANKPRPQSPLDAIKFICKDLWMLVFQKQIDNLKTNHRGVFVLTDQRFQPLSRMSVDRRAGPKTAEDALRRAQAYLYFPCGVIRGALSGLGVEVTVQADTSEIPTATFQIKTKGAKA